MPNYYKALTTTGSWGESKIDAVVDLAAERTSEFLQQLPPAQQAEAISRIASALGNQAFDLIKSAYAAEAGSSFSSEEAAKLAASLMGIGLEAETLALCQGAREGIYFTRNVNPKAEG